ncbi:unnamed protein product, partial [Laminaria digitata]
HSIGRWLAHSSSCPSCRSRVVDDTAEEDEQQQGTSNGTLDGSSPNLAVGEAVVNGNGSPPGAGRSSRRERGGVSTRSVATQARADDVPGLGEEGREDGLH